MCVRYIIVELIKERHVRGAVMLPGSRLRLVNGAGRSLINQGFAKDVDDNQEDKPKRATTKRKRSEAESETSD